MLGWCWLVLVLVLGEDDRILCACPDGEGALVDLHIFHEQCMSIDLSLCCCNSSLLALLHSIPSESCRCLSFGPPIRLVPWRFASGRENEIAPPPEYRKRVKFIFLLSTPRRYMSSTLSSPMDGFRPPIFDVYRFRGLRRIVSCYWWLDRKANQIAGPVS